MHDIVAHGDTGKYISSERVGSGRQVIAQQREFGIGDRRVGTQFHDLSFYGTGCLCMSVKNGNEQQ